MKTVSRKFSLEEDFMNWSTNDLLYAFMRCLSTAKPEEIGGKYREYLPIKTFKKNKKLIASICNCTTKTIDNQLNKLFEKGLIEEGVEVITIYDSDDEYEYECFWFPIDENARFKIVDRDIINYLVNTRNSQAIRIYLYLLNKFQWKKDYIFTIQEIKEALGYAASTKSCDTLIKNVLASFKAEGIIRYEKVIQEKEIGTLNEYKVIPVERMQLKYVIADAADLPSF